VAKILSVNARRIVHHPLLAPAERPGNSAQNTATRETFYAHGVNEGSINTIEFQ
jgi:hypothetical protein